MKRYITSTSLIDVLNDPEGRRLVDCIEEAEEEMRGRGVDFADDSEYYARRRAECIQKLKSEFGFTWK